MFAEFPDAASAIERPVSVAATTSIMFNERFAAFAAQSEASRVAEATQVAEVAPQPELPKLAEPPKTKSSASASVQIALAMPTPRVVESRLAKAGASARDMAQRAKAAVMGVAGDKPDMVEKLWGKAAVAGIAARLCVRRRHRQHRRQRREGTESDARRLGAL